MGTRGDADLMLLSQATDLERIHELHVLLAQSGLMHWCETPYSYLAMTKPSEYSDESRLEVRPAHARYLFVYPFVKTRAWYRLPADERWHVMQEHIKVGREFPEIDLNTSYSFGLDDQEFVVAFETDDPGFALRLAAAAQSEIVGQIDYDAYGKIGSKSGYALYAEGPGVFPITLKHVGMFFPKTVRMHDVANGMAREILYSPDYFTCPRTTWRTGCPAALGVRRLLAAGVAADAATGSRRSPGRRSWAPPISGPSASWARSASRRAASPSAPAIPAPRSSRTSSSTGSSRRSPRPIRSIIHSLLDGPSIAGAYRFKVSREQGCRHGHRVPAVPAPRDPASRHSPADLDVLVRRVRQDSLCGLAARRSMTPTAWRSGTVAASISGGR